MADISGDFAQYAHEANGDRFTEEPATDGFARLGGFLMFAGGLAATAVGHPVGLMAAYKGFKLAVGEEPAKKFPKVLEEEVRIFAKEAGKGGGHSCTCEH